MIKKRGIRSKNKRKILEEKKLKSDIANFIKQGNVVHVFEPDTRKKRKQLHERYIRSKKWKDKCKECFVLFGETCEICQIEGKKLCVHHNNYSSLTEENPKLDLIVICMDCHNKFHEIIPGYKLAKNPQKCKGIPCTTCASMSAFSYKAPKRSIYFCYRCYNIYKSNLAFEKIKIST
jgi:hypothetical protein